MHVLVLNCGSSSLKYALFDGEDDVVASGLRERLSDSGDATHADAVTEILAELSGARIDAVGHRVVHGGPSTTSMDIDEDVRATIEAHSADAPLHNPFALAAVDAAMAALPDVPHVATFDTAFHSTLPRRAHTYAIDAKVAQAHGIRRFGFHGPSHQHAATAAAAAIGRPLEELRLVTLHLGNGASACAVEFGRSTETSMGATPLEGLVMGTRSGDIDAGVVISLLRSGDFDVEAIDDLLNRRSGLAGVSGIGNDLRDVEQAAADGDDRARVAINVFAHRARKYVGAYAATMGGLDGIVFTGGIGENSAPMRRRILQRLGFLGCVVDDDANTDAAVSPDSPTVVVSAPHSRVAAIVVAADEERVIARETRAIATASRPAAPRTIPIAVSGRHLHLDEATFAALFGADASPTPIKDLSQPGQFACAETVDLVGPRDRIDGVRLLGPLRPANQIEISRTDEFRLGVDAPVRNSGKVAGSAPITIEGPAGTVHLAEGLICARRHIHMHPDDAAAFGVEDRDEVSVTITGGERDLAFGDVLVRVKDSYRLEMHIDTDEANAAELGSDAHGGLVHTDVDEAVYVDVTSVRASLA